MNRITAQEAAEKWNISLRRVQDYCKKGRIPGAERFGINWMIPADATRPADGRTKVGRKAQEDLLTANLPMPRKTPFLYMTDLYSASMGAQKSIVALKDNPEAQTLLAAEIAYSKGHIDEVYETANYLLNNHSGFYAMLSAGMLLALAKAVADQEITLSRKTTIFFSVYEEVGHGASTGLPEDTEDLLVVDMGCVGEGLDCTETQVSICAKDTAGPYDYAMTSELIALAQEENLDYAVDVYPAYGSDAGTALRAGHDIRYALIGAGVYASHGYERSHIKGVENTLELILAYVTNA